MDPKEHEVVFGSFEAMQGEQINEGYYRRMVNGKNQMVCLVDIRPGWITKSHKHGNDESMYIVEGDTSCTVGDRTCQLKAGDVIYIPPNVEHELVVGDKGCRMIKVFSPPRADFLDGSDRYLRDAKS
ncbi:MAG: cupin domain-containing protein [Deltaproteobacteria bacterium]|nr:cupin domain-containing protein [Deltaproteobacteria bacterium]